MMRPSRTNLLRPRFDPLNHELSSSRSFPSHNHRKQRRRPSAFHNKGERSWKAAHLDSLDVHTFRVMNYNILADYLAHRHSDYLYPQTPTRILSWQRRWSLILAEITELKPDILCLQEVDQFDIIQSDLGTLGYCGEFLCRSGGCQDGCATFWRVEIQMKDISRISFCHSRVLKDNVALLVVLWIPVENPFPLIVANTHILFNPNRGDIKLAQVRILCDEVLRLVNHHEGASIICGDFNSVPNSGIYKFLTQGAIDLSDYSSKTLSGTISSAFGKDKKAPLGSAGVARSDIVVSSTPAPPSLSEAGPAGVVEYSLTQTRTNHRQWWPKMDPSFRDESRLRSQVPHDKRPSYQYNFSWACDGNIHPQHRARSKRFLLERFHFLQDWKMDHIEITMGQTLSSLCDSVQDHELVFLIENELYLESSYAQVLGNEPHFTTLHNQAKMTLDYIFFTPFYRKRRGALVMKPIQVLEGPTAVNHNSLPNEHYGSDHISLCVDFCTREESKVNSV